MEEWQADVGGGSSVDWSGAGNQSPDEPMSSTADTLKRKKEDDVTESPQTAASDSLCPDQDGQQVQEGTRQSNYQQPCSNQDKTREAPPEQVDSKMQVTVDPKKRLEVIKQLRVVMLECKNYPVKTEHLSNCIDQTQICPEDLLHFFHNYLELQKKLDQGKTNSDQSVESCHKATSSSSQSNSWFSNRWSPSVKVHQIVRGQTCGAHDVILGKVNKSTAVEITAHWQDCDIIIIFCPITCRVGSDVEAAMRNIPVGKPAVLVLMHHTRDVDYSTDVKRWSDDYDSVVLDVHVLFHETLQGLLKCPRNDQAIKQIQKVLHKHSKYGMFR